MKHTSFQFDIRPSSGVPIYRQIMEQVEALVASGKFQPGDLLPSVRQMALDHEINMMTVSKAYNHLEEKGVLERVRGRGMKVCETSDHTTSLSSRKAELETLAEPLIARGQQLGLSEKQILEVIKAAMKEKTND